jgi:hypothetical protein
MGLLLKNNHMLIAQYQFNCWIFICTEVRDNLRMRINQHDIVKLAIADREIELRRMRRRTRVPPSSPTLNDLYMYMNNGNVRISHLMYVRNLY